MVTDVLILQQQADFIVTFHWQKYSASSRKLRSRIIFECVPEEGWFDQPKYIVHIQKSFYVVSVSAFWSRLDHYWSNVHQQDHHSGCLLKHFIVKKRARPERNLSRKRKILFKPQDSLIGFILFIDNSLQHSSYHIYNDVTGLDQSP